MPTKILSKWLLYKSNRLSVKRGLIQTHPTSLAQIINDEADHTITHLEHSTTTIIKKPFSMVWSTMGGKRENELTMCPQVERRTPIVSEVILESFSSTERSFDEWKRCNAASADAAQPRAQRYFMVSTTIANERLASCPLTVEPSLDNVWRSVEKPKFWHAIWDQPDWNDRIRHL